MAIRHGWEPGGVPSAARYGVQGRAFQVAFFLAAFGVAGIVISRWNWANHPTAYWANLLLAGVTDVGFLLFIQLPGYVPLARRLPAPAMFILAAVLTTVAYLEARGGSRASSSPAGGGVA